MKFIGKQLEALGDEFESTVHDERRTELSGLLGRDWLVTSRLAWGYTPGWKDLSAWEQFGSLVDGLGRLASHTPADEGSRPEAARAIAEVGYWRGRWAEKHASPGAMELYRETVEALRSLPREDISANSAIVLADAFQRVAKAQYTDGQTADAIRLHEEAIQVLDRQLSRAGWEHDRVTAPRVLLRIANSLNQLSAFIKTDAEALQDQDPRSIYPALLDAMDLARRMDELYKVAADKELVEGRSGWQFASPHRQLQLAYLLGQVVAMRRESRGAPTNPSLCDELASHVNDPDRRARGVAYEDIDLERALAACKDDTQDSSKDGGRAQYLLGRVVSKDSERTREALELLLSSATAGYTAAFNNLAYVLEHHEWAIAAERTLKAGFVERLLARGFAELYDDLSTYDSAGHHRPELRWLTSRAARLGDPEAQSALGEDLSNDRETRAFHFSIAARLWQERGSSMEAAHAKSKARAHAGSVDVLQHAEERARDWRPTPMPAVPADLESDIELHFE